MNGNDKIFGIPLKELKRLQRELAQKEKRAEKEEALLLDIEHFIYTKKEVEESEIYAYFSDKKVSAIKACLETLFKEERIYRPRTGSTIRWFSQEEKLNRYLKEIL